MEINGRGTLASSVYVNLTIYKTLTLAIVSLCLFNNMLVSSYNVEEKMVSVKGYGR